MENIKLIFKVLAENSHKMNPAQSRLIESMRKYYKRERMLTEKQLGVLYEIRNNI
jgi:hypothetical protein